MNTLLKNIKQGLSEKRRDHLYRARIKLDSPQGPVVQCQGKTLLNFTSNDYLGFANDAQIKESYKQGIDSYGNSSAASQLISGHSCPHAELEESLAAFTGYERCLVFSTGYMANLALQCALLKKNESVYMDRLVHASIIDAARLAGVRIRRYQHCDMDSLRAMLLHQTAGAGMVITDGVFSMDGDLAPLNDLATLANKHDLLFAVDDAHGFGVLGKQGLGTPELQGIQQSPDIYLATFGKALGTFGAFVAAPADIIEHLIQSARSYIYTTALPPAIATATLTALRLMKSESWRREHLAVLVQRFRSGAQQLGLPLKDSNTPIQPLILYDEEKALRLSQDLFAKDILVTAIRPPTVPRGSARLRITLTAAHTEEQVDQLLGVLDKCHARSANVC